jgi:hypothetical protein
MMQNKKMFENQDSKLLDKEVSGSNNSDIKIQNQSLQNTSSAIIPNLEVKEQPSFVDNC